INYIVKEQLCPNSLACTETLEAIVNDPLQMHSVEIKILDTNDHSPVFPGKSQTIRVAESALVGSKFPLLGADDPDIGINSISSYKLSQNAFFNLEVHTDADQGPSAELVLLKSLDRERQATLRLVLTAVDGGRPPRSGTTEIHVVVLDANDNAPAFSKSVYKVSVPENTAIGTSVKYSFKQGQKGISDTFSIDFNTGEISLIGELDYESTGAYEIRVEARDGGSTPLASHCKVLVEVVDVNDNAPEIKLSSLLDSVPEDSRKGTVIALITVQDKDGGKNGKVHCFMSKNSPFVLESTQGKYYSLVLSGALDREEKQIYNVSITAIDEGTPPLSSTTVVTVRVSDVNDNPPRFPEASVNVYVKENSPAGSKFPLLGADDPDIGINSISSYKLSQNTFFNLEVHTDADQGPSAELVLLKSLDRERQATFRLVLTAVDGGRPPRSGTTEIHVVVLDANDNAPVFSKSLYKVLVSEDVALGTSVLKLNATDLDEGINSELLYSFKQGQKGISDKFTIDPGTGEISVIGELDYESTSAYEIRVEARDGGSTPLASHCKVLVEVVDVNDNAPEIKLSSLLDSVREDARKDTAIALITVQDKDGGKNGKVHCSMSKNSPFVLESTQEKYYSLVLSGTLDREKNELYNVSITATDEGTPPLSGTTVLTVRVSDVNDNPPLFPEASVNLILSLSILLCLTLLFKIIFNLIFTQLKMF
uniref:Cadherin domain-containing protein n=1 Tax=Astyanax mexicanus TaxID=7994 RepID=A0A3B1J5T9_ASTMX